MLLPWPLPVEGTFEIAVIAPLTRTLGVRKGALDLIGSTISKILDYEEANREQSSLPFSDNKHRMLFFEDGALLEA